MKLHYFLIPLVLTISGCSLFSKPVPIVPKFPEAVPELMKKCQPLEVVHGDKIAIDEFLKTVIKNYGLYYECSLKVDGWQEWYTEQRKNYETIKK